LIQSLPSQTGALAITWAWNRKLLQTGKSLVLSKPHEITVSLGRLKGLLSHYKTENLLCEPCLVCRSRKFAPV